jgi:GrpB-like predicted nucleotidyltransferase (UPF0157 family)
MPAPIPVVLCPYDPSWAALAQDESQRLSVALGPVLVVVHHIGSTAIPGIRAKPVIDLLPVVLGLTELDDARSAIESLGYQWWGEYGLPGRRYCSLDDPLTGLRRIQLHCYEQTSKEIARHLAFRDYLRSQPDLAHEYEAEKERCRALHPLDSHAYTNCKNAWVRRIEAEALAAVARSPRK